jgi:hypothetical protein
MKSTDISVHNNAILRKKDWRLTTLLRDGVDGYDEIDC